MITKFKIFEELKMMNSSDIEAKVSWNEQIVKLIDELNPGFWSNGYELYSNNDFLVGIDVSSIFGIYTLIAKEKSKQNRRNLFAPTFTDDEIIDEISLSDPDIPRFFNNISKTVELYKQKAKQLDKSRDFNL